MFLIVLGAACIVGTASSLARKKGYGRGTTAIVGMLLLVLGGAVGSMLYFIENGPSAPVPSPRFEGVAGGWIYAGPVLVLLFRFFQKNRSAVGTGEADRGKVPGPIQGANGDRDLVEEYRRARENLYGPKQK